MSARSSAVGAAGVVAVLLNNVEGVFQRSVMQGADEVAAAHGLALEPTPLGGVAEAAVRETLAGVLKRAAGALVLASALGDDELAGIAETGIPVTLVSHHSAALELPTLMFDNDQGLERLMKHVVVDCGRRHPVFIGGDPAQLDARERERAFLDEVLRHDLRVPRTSLLAGDFSPEVAAAALSAFVGAGGRPDSVVAADYLMAIAAQEVVRAAGLRVPEDVVVVGYGDGPEAEAAGVTTVAADVVELGRRAARQLVAQLSGRPLRGRTLLSTHLVKRASSSPDGAPRRAIGDGAPDRRA